MSRSSFEVVRITTGIFFKCGRALDDFERLGDRLAPACFEIEQNKSGGVFLGLRTQIGLGPPRRRHMLYVIHEVDLGKRPRFGCLEIVRTVVDDEKFCCMSPPASAE